MTASIWIDHECVTEHGAGPIPRKEDSIRLDIGKRKGYYTVSKILFSYREVPTTFRDQAPLIDNRIEIHVRKDKKKTPAK